MKIDRKELLDTLQSVAPGLSNQAIIEQSTHFLFQDSRVYTFNDEITVSNELKLPFSGAVLAVPLLSLLSKMPDEKIKMEENEEGITVRGRRQTAFLHKEAEICNPLDVVEEPGEWKALPANFMGVLRNAALCAGNDESRFLLTCVHITDKYVEATDNMQAVRYQIQTPIENAIVPVESINKMRKMEVNKVSTTKNWIHFGCGDLRLSCRAYYEHFPNLNFLLEHEGMDVTLPEGMEWAVKKADIFASELSADRSLQITLQDNLMTVRGTGMSGWFEEKQIVSWGQKPLTFNITTGMIENLFSRKRRCKVGKNKISIKGEHYTYVVGLSGDRK